MLSLAVFGLTIAAYWFAVRRCQWRRLWTILGLVPVYFVSAFTTGLISNWREPFWLAWIIFPGPRIDLEASIRLPKECFDRHAASMHTIFGRRGEATSRTKVVKWAKPILVHLVDDTPASREFTKHLTSLATGGGLSIGVAAKREEANFFVRVQDRLVLPAQREEAAGFDWTKGNAFCLTSLAISNSTIERAEVRLADTGKGLHPACDAPWHALGMAGFPYQAPPELFALLYQPSVQPGITSESMDALIRERIQESCNDGQ